jgi:Short C-terminal domain
VASANAKMEAVKSFIEGKARESAARQGAGGSGLADEILKLALLREQGILTHDEFETAKRRLLGAG